ncbi:VgrG-related protein [Streptomyces sp. NPDC051704]|uniref:VgrG-related protein n=1 Tax=Streptomyces sp. NPDC051704 TaxID=3365671 RepID=UPI0037A78CCC
MTGRHTAGLDIKVAGTSFLPEIADVLAWASVEEDGRTSAKAEIGFRDPRNASLFKKSRIALGSAVELTAITPSGPVPLFSGEVTECEARASTEVSGRSGHTGGVMTVIRARDLSHRLRRGRRTAAYPGMTAGKVVEKVAERAGVTGLSVDDTGFSYEYLSQPSMSDWDFLSHLARENGRDLYVRDGKLHFRKREGSGGEAVALRFGDNLVNVRLAASLGHQVPSVEVRGWDREKKVAIASVHTPRRDGTWKSPVSSSHYAPMALTGLPRRHRAEAAAVAESMAHEVAAGLVRLHAVVHGEPRLRLRSAVTLTGLGPQFGGRFTVTGVRHHFHPVQGYRTELTVDEGVDRSAGQPGDAEEGLRRVRGFVRGKVVDINDPEERGRVRVKLEWLGEKYETTWAETVQLSGSLGHGVVLPEVDDVVAVVFEQGCLDSPLVVGAVDDPIDKVGHTMPLVDGGRGGKGRTNLRTFASKDGHRLELVDKNGRGMGATLITGGEGSEAGGLRIQLDASKTVISIDSKGRVEIKGAKGVSVDAGSGPLQLKGNSVTVTADKDISLKGVNVDMNASARLKAHGAKAEFSGSAVAELKAPMVKIN